MKCLITKDNVVHTRELPQVNPSTRPIVADKLSVLPIPIKVMIQFGITMHGMALFLDSVLLVCVTCIAEESLVHTFVCSQHSLHLCYFSQSQHNLCQLL